MTHRISSEVSHVIWRDVHNVEEQDLTDEQSANLQLHSAIVNNFFGSGLLLSAPSRTTIFDSDNLTSQQQIYVSTNDFDGRGILPHGQVSDSSLGNQIEVTLTDSEVTLRKSVKVCILGLNFEGVIDYETFTFYRNEIQVGRKHFRQIISFMFNDFKGNKYSSIALGGRITIKEAMPMELSRDAIIASQNLEPNLFFRDFKTYDPTISINISNILYDTIQEAIGTAYSVDSLNIYVGYNEKKQLDANDISTRYGQKFLSKSNNIQKVRLLLGVDAVAGPEADRFAWSGDVIVSIHELQTSVSCPTDTIPENAIDYQPNPAPLAQIVLTQATLENEGIVLTDVAQPIDFCFSTTRIGATVNSGITQGNYYVVTVTRAGNTTVGDLFTLVGRNLTDDSVFTTFNGVNWTDDQDRDMWFEVFSDCLKVADGNGFDSGNNLSVPKTAVDETSGAVIDYCEDGILMTNYGQNITNHIIAQSIAEQTDIVQDSISGQPVFSREKFVGEISSVTTAQLSTLSTTQEPIVVGCAYDINNRTAITINKSLAHPGLALGNTFNIIAPDATLKLTNLVGAKLTPNIDNANSPKYLVYRISLCTDGYGDLNGDGYVGLDDVTRANELVGLDYTTAPVRALISAGTYSILEFIRADIDGDGVISISDVDVITAIYQKNSSEIVLPFGATFERMVLYLENLYGRNDAFYSSDPGYIRILTSTPDKQSYVTLSDYELLWYGYPVPVSIETSEPAIIASPFIAVNYQLDITPIWNSFFLKTAYTARFLPCAFTSSTSTPTYSCEDINKFYCSNFERTATTSGGAVNMFIPDNLIIGNGQILGSDGNYFPIDIESKVISFTLPSTAILDKSIDIFDIFIADETGTSGFTSKGFAAMKFSDCSYVTKDALALNQIRMGLSIESMAQNIDGYSPVDGYGAIIDPLVGTFLNHNTGVLTIRASNVYGSNINNTLNCRINITVMAKKSGWKNKHMDVTSDELTVLLDL